MASQTLTFSAQVDTYVDKSSASSNYPSSYTLKTGIGVSGQRQNARYAAFFGFDISSIPLNDVIKSVKLRIYLTGIIHGDTGSSAYSDSSGTYLPIVVRARRVTGYTNNELATTLSYNTVSSKLGLNNVYAANMDYGDSSYMLNYHENSYIEIPINDVSRSNEIIIAVFRDDNYLNDWAKVYGGVFASKEYGVNYEPKLIVSTEDYIPQKPTNLIPNNTVRNPGDAVRLSWTFSDPLVNTSQASYEVMYSVDNFATFGTATGTTNSYHVLPVGAFSGYASAKWKVRITDTNGDTSEWSDIATFSIGATTPSAPEVLSPINTIVNSSDVVVFRWKFNDNYGYSQAKFDLQYKQPNNPETSITITSSDTQYSMPKEILSGGDYSWRVRCYNSFNEVGPYSDWASFYSIGKPALPIILSVSNNMHPLVKWSATEQDLFIIKIYSGGSVIYDSGEQISNSEYQIPDFIPNGSYKLGLQIRNIYGFWSNEATFNFTVSVSKPSKPNLSYSVNDLYVAIIITSSTATNLIYRKGSKDNDFKLIATVTTNTFEDYTVPAGEVQYFVRAINNDGYNDGDIRTATINFDGIVISGYDNQTDFIQLSRTRDSDKRKTVSTSRIQYKIHCNGRQYPISQSTENKNHSESHEYYISPGDYDKFYRIATEYSTVIYRNNYGYSFRAEMSAIAIQEDVFGYIVSFLLTRLEE